MGPNGWPGLGAPLVTCSCVEPEPPPPHAPPPGPARSGHRGSLTVQGAGLSSPSRCPCDLQAPEPPSFAQMDIGVPLSGSFKVALNIH